MKKSFVTVSILFLMGCGGGEHMVLPANTMPTSGQNKTGSMPVAGLSFQQTIRPLIEKKCASCHGQGSALGNWLDYNQVFLKKDRILQRVVVKKDMPIGGTLEDAERKIFEKWIQEGAIEGEAVIAPTPDEPPTVAPAEPPPVVAPEAPREPSVPPVTGAVYFVKDIQPLFERSCAICHNAGSGDLMPNWLDYATSFNKRERLLDRIYVKKDMPLGTEMSDAERELVKRWIEGGALFDKQPSVVEVN